MQIEHGYGDTITTSADACCAPCTEGRTITECEIDYDCTPILDFSTYKTINAELEANTNWGEISTHKLSIPFIEYYKDKLVWSDVLKNNSFDTWHLEHFSDHFDTECWSTIIPRYQTLEEQFIATHRYVMNWDVLSQYQKMSEDFMSEFRKYISWPIVSRYQAMSEEFIIAHEREVSWVNISRYQTLSENFIDVNNRKVNWSAISEAQVLSEAFIDVYAESVAWKEISRHQKLSDEFIMTHIDRLDISAAILNNTVSEESLDIIFGSAYLTDEIVHTAIISQTFSEDFMRGQEVILDTTTNAWKEISRHQTLSEEFIDDYSDVLDWAAISRYQTLSEVFIEEHSNLVDWSEIFAFQDLSSDFMERHKNEA